MSTQQIHQKCALTSVIGKEGSTAVWIFLISYIDVKIGRVHSLILIIIAVSMLHIQKVFDRRIPYFTKKPHEIQVAAWVEILRNWVI